MPKRAVAHTDGGNRTARGLAAYGVVIETGDETICISQSINGDSSNNEAEYQGLLAALRWAVRNEVTDLEIIMDAEVIVRQMTGVYVCRAPNLIPLHRKALNYAKAIPFIRFTHVLREFNAEADRLANEAMDAEALEAVKEAA